MSANSQEVQDSAGRETGDVMLELSEVSKRFGGLAAVQDVNLVIRKGEIISVIGPNGAGKTTVFNLITGIYHPTTGDIRLQGRSLVGSAPIACWYTGLRVHSRIFACSII